VNVHRALGLTLLCALAACPSRTASTLHGAPRYAQSARWEPPPSERADYERVARAATGEAPVPDDALAAVASDLARRVARDPQARTPSVRVIQAVSWLAGVSDPLPVVLTVKGGAAAVDAEVERALRELFQAERVTHVGVGRVPSGGDVVVVVAATRRRVRLEPVARTVAVGARVSLRGALGAGLRAPVMVVTLPDGRTEESPLGEGPEFVGQFPVTVRGAYQFELTAESEAGSTVVANFPVYADVDPPATPEETGSLTAEEPAAAEAELLRLINESRRRANLPALEAMAPLAAVARAHSVDMAENRYVAHNSRSGATPGQRLRDASLLSGLSLENVARGYGAREIHDGLMASPGHRANVLDRRVTHVGIGAARETGPSAALLVTQDFIEVSRAIDPAAVAIELVATINRNRVSRGLPPLTARPQLTAAAERAARGYFEDAQRTQEQSLAEATGALRNEGLLFRRIAAAAAFGTNAEEAAAMQPLFDREVTAIGVGVAQGDRPGAPPRSVFVVYVLAVPR
jgi:uncharacterized protein YkwD